MRRLLFSWSIGVLGGVLSVGCVHDKCPRCGYSDPGPLHALMSKPERSASRTAKADLPKPVDPNSQRLLAISETGSPDNNKSASETAAPLVPEQPVVEQPLVKQPVTEPPAPELPVRAQPVVHHPLAKLPVAELPPAAGSEKGSPELPPVVLPFGAGKMPPTSSRGVFVPPTDDPSAPGSEVSGQDVRKAISSPGLPNDTIERWVGVPDAKASSGSGFTTLTNASMQGGAAEDYKTLTGHVTAFRKSWRLRYAAIETEDAFGGSVALNGPGLERLRDGQLVRVQGTVLSAADRNQPAVFQVKSIEVLAPGN